MGMSERIKERRIAMGFTQEELGQKLGLQKSAIAKYENGRVKNIKRSVISSMAEFLECSPAYLMGWDDSPTSQETNEDIRRIARAHKQMPEDVKKQFMKIVTDSFDVYFSDDYKDDDTDE